MTTHADTLSTSLGCPVPLQFVYIYVGIVAPCLFGLFLILAWMGFCTRPCWRPLTRLHARSWGKAVEKAEVEGKTPPSARSCCWSVLVRVRKFMVHPASWCR